MGFFYFDRNLNTSELSGLPEIVFSVEVSTHNYHIHSSLKKLCKKKLEQINLTIMKRKPSKKFIAFTRLLKKPLFWRRVFPSLESVCVSDSFDENKP